MMINCDITEFINISQLINVLNVYTQLHGDLPICVKDCDTSWRLPIGVVHKRKKDDLPERFEIVVSYHGDPEGMITKEDF